MHTYLTRIKQYAKFYAAVISIFTFFRVILLINEYKHVPESDFELLINSFVMGWRFDSVIFCYLFIVALIFKLILDILFTESKTFKLWKYLTFYLFSFSFLLSAIDIPLFNYNFSRLNIAFISWLDKFDIVIPMVTSESQYAWIIIPFLLILLFFRKINNKIFQNTKFFQKTQSLIFHIPLILILVVLSRGRFSSKSPIRIGTAYFSQNAFINQLGLNPIFTLLKSGLNQKKYKNNRFATANIPADYQERVLKMLNREQFSKFEVGDTQYKKKNIVLIMMESMSAEKMGTFENPNNLTPFLDSLFKKGISFKNAYTMGIHTFNGIYSTLFSYPSILDEHPMKVYPIPKIKSIPKELENLGYHNIYFTTHDQEFDNVAGFLKLNGFHEIISQKDFPSEKVTSTLGVPDDYLFEYGIKKLNQLNEKKQPFFAAFMTVSDHGPYQLPPWIEDHFTAKTINQKMTQYADWSLEKFFTLAQKQDWYKDTIFVLIADHGASIDKTYLLSLSYTHSPLIFFDPSNELIKKPEIKNDIVSQVDVLPSTLGLLGLPYLNHTMGLNIFKTNREFAYFNSDQKIGVITKEHYFIFEDEQKYIYKYQNQSKENLLNQFPDLAQEAEKNYWSILKMTHDKILK